MNIPPVYSRQDSAVVLTTLLYGSETWTAHRRHEKQLNHFYLRCSQNLLHICWQNKVPDTEVLEQKNFPIIITIMRKVQPRWAGHVSRMPDDRIPKQLLYGELCQCKRTVKGQRKRFKDGLKNLTSALRLGCLTPRTDPPGATSSTKELTQQRRAGPFKLSGNVQHARLEPPVPTPQRLPTSTLPVGDPSLPGLASQPPPDTP